ncbi:sigma-70 family RNA polymerase sigma factor [Dokdonella sp.]|uniref:RNA polymerase sigma factor n=1 Tax=Dokdonella sp. TaxID=2291710 RepID=UPI0027B89347|nr:sigma-70 family RNA polymerase sigma factor [Dokdonella sp.]
MTSAVLTMAQARQQQFQALLERHRGVVFKVANSYARGAQNREDLAQEIAAQLWRAFPQYDGTRAFSTWMYRVALNVAISHLRERSRYDQHHQALDPADHEVAIDEADAESAARVRELYRLIDSFDPLNRALLLLYLDERSQREIAEILGLTETNVATKIGRLKSNLRDKLAAAT